MIILNVKLKRFITMDVSEMGQTSFGFEGLEVLEMWLCSKGQGCVGVVKYLRFL